MTTDELKLLHNKILELAHYFEEFCTRHGIEYYLMGGTALGAMRHGGFIPWDDDFDVFMDYENYQKFLEVARSSLDTENYYFQEENTQEWPMYFSKIRINNTTFIEEDIKDRKMHHGIYIDIMCLNNASSNNSIRYLQYLSARVLNTRALAQRGYITHSKVKKTALLVSKFLVNGAIKRGLLSFVRSFNAKECELVGHFFGRAPFSKTSFPKAYLSPQRYVKFENLMLPVPNQVEMYLMIRYGAKYMDLPSEEEKNKYPSHAYIVDVNKSYIDFMNIEKNDT
jgi:lipopolysaccharide cholinephosphotransferase